MRVCDYGIMEGGLWLRTGCIGVEGFRSNRSRRNYVAVGALNICILGY